MSVTFSVSCEEKVDEDTLYTFSMDRVRKDPSGRISDLISSEYGGDIGYHFYEEEAKLKRAGRTYGKTINEWVSIFRRFGNVEIDSGESYVFNVTHPDGGEIMLSVWPIKDVDKYEVQMSNTNAHTILKLLGLIKSGGIENAIENMSGREEIGDDLFSQVMNAANGDGDVDWYTGKVSPHLLMSRIDEVESNPNLISEFTRNPYDSGNNQGARIYGGGIDSEYILRQLSALDRLAAYALQNECDIVWG
jgi:hypothetical protein